MEIDAAADELYGLNPAEFTQARDALVAQVRKEGDREAADQLKRMRRPSIGAWMANLLVRARRDDMEHLIAVGSSLRKAQDRLDGDAMRRLTVEGHATVTALVDTATGLVRDAGENVSPGSRGELESTLDAALMDSDAAEALRQGRLTTGLTYSGLGLVGIEGARGSGPVPSKKPSARAKEQPASRAEQTGAERELEVARRELARAKARAADSESAVAIAQTRLKDLKERAADRRRSVREAEKAVRTAEKALGALGGHRT